MLGSIYSVATSHTSSIQYHIDAEVGIRKPPSASILVSPAVTSNSAGEVMTATAQEAHKLELVSIVRREDSMTQV